MNTLLSKLRSFTHPLEILHIRLVFPLWPQKIDICLRHLDKFQPKGSKAVFLSLNGIAQSPDSCQLIHDAIKHKQEVERIPVYTFLQDRISALTYYVGSPSTKIIANPYCLMGDLTVAHKRYDNIAKLLNYFGINMEKFGQKQSGIWEKFVEPNQREKNITNKWLQVVENNLKESLKFRRKIPQNVIEEFGKKIISPKKALQLSLIDSIGTPQQVKAQSFPNHNIKQVNISGPLPKAHLTKSQVNLLQKIIAHFQMPQTVMMSMQDPISTYLQEFMVILSQRLQDPSQLESLDIFIGDMINKWSEQLSNFKHAM